MFGLFEAKTSFNLVQSKPKLIQGLKLEKACQIQHR